MLDLGCGYGWHCGYAAAHGAAGVLGTDMNLAVRPIVPVLGAIGGKDGVLHGEYEAASRRGRCAGDGHFPKNAGDGAGAQPRAVH